MGNRQSNKFIEKSQTNIDTKNKQMNNLQIDQALIKLLYSAIKLIEMRTEFNSNYDSSSDSESESDSESKGDSDSDYVNSESESDSDLDDVNSESETDESMSELISDSENNLDSDYNDLSKFNIENEECDEHTNISDYTVYKKGNVHVNISYIELVCP